MRVAMIILEYMPITGGAQRQLARIAPLLQARGVDVQVLTRRAPGLAVREELDGVAVHRLPAPGPKAVASSCFTVAALAHLARLRPDVIHAYSLFSPATVAVLVDFVRPTPVVVKVLRGGPGGDLERLQRKPFSSLRLAWLRRHVDRFLTISREIDAELAAVAVDAAARLPLPNGVDLETFRPAGEDERAALRAELGLADEPLVLYCGRLVPEKGVDDLLEAWRGVRETHPEARLAIVGAGPEEARLRALAGPGVLFLGRRDAVAPLLRAADLFVLPSHTEGLSNALLEAMASALPVVATRVGAAPELVDEAVGRLVAPRDVSGLRRAIGELLDQPKPSPLAARARERVAARYSLESVAERLVDLYGELLAGRRARGVAERGAPLPGGDA